MRLNSPANPQKYLTALLMFSLVRTMLTSYTSSENSLNHSIHLCVSPHRISCASFSTSEISQGNDWTTSCWIRWINICMPRSFWSVFQLMSHRLCSTFLRNMTTKLGKLPLATTRSGWGCCHVSICSHPNLFLLVGQWKFIQHPP